MNLTSVSQAEDVVVTVTGSTSTIQSTTTALSTTVVSSQTTSTTTMSFTTVSTSTYQDPKISLVSTTLISTTSVPTTTSMVITSVQTEHESITVPTVVTAASVVVVTDENSQLVTVQPGGTMTQPTVISVTVAASEPGTLENFLSFQLCMPRSNP